MANKFLNILSVVISTFGSRVLGLLRDILIFASFGTTALNSAFLLAFTLPNLFRRLLGEGALNAALVPMLAEELEENQKKGAFIFLNQVLTRVLFILFIVVIALGVILYLLRLKTGLDERWYLGAGLGIVLLPYLVLICTAALIHAGLNILNRFTIAALSPVWLNLSMIISLGVFGIFIADKPIDRIAFLCGGVILGGLLQVILPALSLNREGWKPRFDTRSSARMEELFFLYLPGLAGAAIYQINIVVNRILAFWLDDAAVSILYLANRFLELPLGVFAIAVTTVIFPSLSQLAAKNNLPAFTHTFYQGLKMILAITIPASMGLIILREPILNLLFVWGVFESKDVIQTMPVVATLALALPFYATGTLIIRGFYALKDTRTPVRVSVLNLILNLVFSLTLMWPLGVIGLALANVISTVFPTLILYWLLVRKTPELGTGNMRMAISKILMAGGIMSILTILAWMGIELWITDCKQAALVAVCLLIPVAIAVYFSLLWILQFDELKKLRLLIESLLDRWKNSAMV